MAETTAEGMGDGMPGIADPEPAEEQPTPTTSPAEPPPYWECDVVLVDGSTMHVRPIRPSDADALVRFHSRLSKETVFLRFFSARPTLPPAMVERFTNVDYSDRVALVAEKRDRLIAVARYDREAGTDSAEVAFVVADEYQGRGIGTLLLEHLAAIARERGLHRFVAHTLASNHHMLGVFRAAGFTRQTRLEHDVVRVELVIEPTDLARAAIEEREHRAEAASVARVLTPRSVAVIGASTRPGTVGHAVLRSLLNGGFAGPVYPVNPSAAHVASVRAYSSVLDVPDDVDVAVIAVPAPGVLDVVRQCGQKGVAGLVVLTAGFSEVGDVEAQNALRDVARRNGMRLIGPNCIGIINTAIGLNATFSPYAPPPGRIAMQSQSGAVGIAILERSARFGLGVSSFVSVGNKADVSGNDMLQYWEDDPSTDVVLLYLESFGNPRKFSRIARRVSRRKPIVAVKSGRTAAGVRAASSHTAAMASADVAVDALFHQTGVIRVDTLDELFDMALVLGSQRPPGGGRVAIVGNSGGPGILATDACDGAGLTIAPLSDATQAALRDLADPNASVANPVDLVASADPENYADALRVIAGDESVDAIVAICTPTFAAPPRRVAEVVSEVAAHTDKTVVACFLAWPEMPSVLRSEGGEVVPAFSSPEPAARALGRAVRYEQWRARPPGRIPDLQDFDGDTAEAFVSRYLDRHPEGGWLSPSEVEALWTAAGIPHLPTAAVSSADEAATVAAKIGLPVALKAVGERLIHKSDVGGVRLGLGSAASVAEAYDEMASSIGGLMSGAVVQPMAPAGVETIVGVVHDQLFGPLVMFGMGGVATELVGDRGFRILPLTDVDAAELVRSLRTSPLLFGYRGSPPADVEAIKGVLHRVARLAEQVPSIAELEMNPLIVSTAGAVAVDARMRVAPAPHSFADDLRRLRT